MCEVSISSYGLNLRVSGDGTNRALPAYLIRYGVMASTYLSVHVGCLVPTQYLVGNCLEAGQHVTELRLLRVPRTYHTVLAIVRYRVFGDQYGRIVSKVGGFNATITRINFEYETVRLSTPSMF